MKNQNDLSTDNPASEMLARKLRDEALADSPPFSPLLHARIMQQIEAHAPASRAVRARSPWRIGWTLPTSASAAAVAVLALTLWLYNQQTTKNTAQEKVAIKPMPIPQLAIEFPNLSEPADSPLSLAHYGNLDRDAKAAADYVKNQFDIIPSPPARHG